MMLFAIEDGLAMACQWFAIIQQRNGIPFFFDDSFAMPKKLALPWHKHWDKHWLCKAGLGNGLSGHVLKTAWQGLRNGVVMSQGLGKALAMP